jgi:hypothetical protein
MSIKIGTVDPIAPIPRTHFPPDEKERIHVYAAWSGGDARVQLCAGPCDLSISDARCLVSLLELAIRQAKLRSSLP